MEQLKEVLQVLLAVAIPLAAFATGLGAGASGPDSFWRHPGQLVRALVAILVAVPLWALLFLELLPLAPVTRTGVMIAVLAVGIGPVAGMKRLQGAAPAARLGFELNLTVLAISIVYVPLAVWLLGRSYHREVSLGIAAVAKIVLLRALIPMLIGAWLAREIPRFAAKVRIPLGIGVNVTVALVLVVVLIATWRQLLEVGAVGWLTCAAVAVGAVLIGHFLGGPAAQTRNAVAIASAMRFPALALLLASIAPLGRQLIPVVFVYVVIALLAVTVYGWVTHRRRREAPHAMAPAPA
jgi:bile acid:Na+ symporter, BASS family